MCTKSSTTQVNLAVGNNFCQTKSFQVNLESSLFCETAVGREPVGAEGTAERPQGVPCKLSRLRGVCCDLSRTVEENLIPAN